jgi:hypothetical protein
LRITLFIVVTLIWQSVYADSVSPVAPETEGRICIASVEAPNEGAKSLNNPAGENPDVAYSVKIADHSPIAISRESGTWLEGLKVGAKLPVIIYEDGKRAASFYVQFGNDEFVKCLFMNTLYRTWQVWSWDRVGAWCDCDSVEND